MNPSPPALTAWRPLPVSALRRELGGFKDWVLCGGHSVARLVGRDTRPHGDIDVGVFRSQLVECLRVFGRNRVYLCRRGAHEPWNGGRVPTEVHDIWITDRPAKSWVLQVMVFDDRGGQVIYRRDRRIRWAKKFHAVKVGGIKVLNPFVTVLFKANKATLEPKEIHDIVQLLETLPFRRRGKK